MQQIWPETFSGWWFKNHLEKYESQWEGWHPIYEMENRKCLKPPTSFAGLNILERPWNPGPPTGRIQGLSPAGVAVGIR